jgi:CHASE2 domain-containing sensor protein
MPTFESFESKRAVEILTPNYGSGYRIGGRLVLTAAHLFKDDASQPLALDAKCKVRSKIDTTIGTVNAELVWISSQIDAALIKLPDSVPAVKASGFGLLPAEKQAKSIDFELYGWPEWARTKRPDENEKSGGRYITGKIYLADTSGENFLVVEPERLPEAPIPGEKGSQWEGISGAAVVCKDLIVAIQRHHQNPKRPASLEAQPLSALYDDYSWQKLLKQHGIKFKPKAVPIDPPEPRPSLANIGVTSCLITLLILFTRSLGLLEFLELSAYDFLMVRRPPLEQDDHVALIGIDTNNTEMTDQELLVLLENLNQEKNRPRVIALDIYRNNASPELEEFLEREASSNVISACLLRAELLDSGDLNPIGQPPYPEIKQENLGFTDFYPDGNNKQATTARRQLLKVHSEAIEESDLTGGLSLCKPLDSLSYKSAYEYLRPLGYRPEYSTEYKITLASSEHDQLSIYPLDSRAGGYQGQDHDPGVDYQIMVNYRPLGKEGQDSFYSKEFTVPEIQNLGSESLEGFKDKLVFIGYTSLDGNVNDDTILIPARHRDLLTSAQRNSGLEARIVRKAPGVVVHAHMASQIINAALEGRPLIWVFKNNRSLNILWILVWVTAAGSITWLVRRPLWKFLSYTLLTIGLGLTCYLTLAFLGGWLPLIPPILGIVLMGFWMWLYTRIRLSE